MARFLSPILALGLVASACSSPASPAPQATASPTALPTATPSPTLGPSQLLVSSRANIFGAGRDTPPAPDGGGEGVLPPEWPLSPGSALVTFPSVTGKVNPVVMERDFNGPGGDHIGPTDIESYQGISGIVNAKNAMFVVGVFLTDDPPSDPAPPRLDFTDEEFDLLEPEIGQTFLIGDGIGRRYRVPAGATRLFLGFADSSGFHGPPGYYNNNSGDVVVTVEVEAE